MRTPTPTTTKPKPATHRMNLGLKYSATREPPSTPSAEVRINAVADAAKTVHFGCEASDAYRSVASCVLSPSSATKTVKKTVAKS